MVLISSPHVGWSAWRGMRQNKNSAVALSNSCLASTNSSAVCPRQQYKKESLSKAMLINITPAKQ
jgi:hypothetical protein